MNEILGFCGPSSKILQFIFFDFIVCVLLFIYILKRIKKSDYYLTKFIKFSTNKKIGIISIFIFCIVSFLIVLFFILFFTVLTAKYWTRSLKCLHLQKEHKSTS